MIYLSSLYKDFVTRVNTSQDGFFRIITDFVRAANDASISLWNELVDEAENSQSVTDDLRNFIRTKNMIVSSTNSTYGYFKYPAEYGRYSAARLIIYNSKTVGYKDCEICDSSDTAGDEQAEFERVERYLDGIKETDVKKVDSSKWAAALTNLTKMPTLSKPIIKQNDNGFNVAPRNVSVVVLDYYVQPVNGTIFYTLTPFNSEIGDGNDIIFDDSKSIPLQWSESVKNRLLDKIVDIYISYTRDGLLQQIKSAQKPLE